MNTGWIKIHRQLMDREDYFCPKFDEVHAWIDLLLIANYEDTTKVIRGIKKEVHRGEISESISWFCERWGWGRNTVVNFFKKLEAEKQIILQKSNVQNTVAIVNYERFQNFDTTDSTTDEEKVPPYTPLKENIKRKEEEDIKRNIINDITKKELFERKRDFQLLIAPFVDKYGRTLCNDFFAYWTQVDAKTGLMRFEEQKQFFVKKRLAYFKRRQNE